MQSQYFGSAPIREEGELRPKSIPEKFRIRRDPEERLSSTIYASERKCAKMGTPSRNSSHPTIVATALQ